jgi:hypothetical protein
MTQTISVASAGRRDRGFMDNPSGLPTTPQPHQHQPGRTFDPSVKADIFTRHGQPNLNSDRLIWAPNW